MNRLSPDEIPTLHLVRRLRDTGYVGSLCHLVPQSVYMFVQQTSDQECTLAQKGDEGHP